MDPRNTIVSIIVGLVVSGILIWITFLHLLNDANTIIMWTGGLTVVFIVAYIFIDESWKGFNFWIPLVIAVILWFYTVGFGTIVTTDIDRGIPIAAFAGFAGWVTYRQLEGKSWLSVYD